jgi:hypothetical protein
MTLTNLLILAGALIAFGFASGLFEELRGMTAAEVLQYSTLAAFSLACFIAAFWLLAFFAD